MVYLIILINYQSQTGLVIIDSPGVGDSDEMDNMVIQYLPEAFAFIYVTNSSLGGGVQKDKVNTWIVWVLSIKTKKKEDCFFFFKKATLLSFFMQMITITLNNNSNNDNNNNNSNYKNIFILPRSYIISLVYRLYR